MSPLRPCGAADSSADILSSVAARCEFAPHDRLGPAGRAILSRRRNGFTHPRLKGVNRRIEPMLKFIGGTVGVIFLIGLLVVIGLLALIF